MRESWCQAGCAKDNVQSQLNSHLNWQTAQHVQALCLRCSSQVKTNQSSGSVPPCPPRPVGAPLITADHWRLTGGQPGLTLSNLAHDLTLATGMKYCIQLSACVCGAQPLSRCAFGAPAFGSTSPHQTPTGLQHDPLHCLQF